MYKIMLADDEGIVIDSVKFIIEKEFGDQCIVEFAKTGRSVIELAESFRPERYSEGSLKSLRYSSKNSSPMTSLISSAALSFISREAVTTIPSRDSSAVSVRS